MSALIRLLALLSFLAPAAARAEQAAFDLSGPPLRVTISHRGQALPIAQVPQLATGDTIAVRADLPSDQAAHYLLIAAFLRGSTNPPPDKWFFQSETWTKKGGKGLTLTVPDGAQQLVLFLAPATGGDFPTLRNAVQGKPGAFVRAAQDLAQATLDRARLDAYLAAVRRPAPGDPRRLERITPLLARSLQVKVNTDCLTKQVDLQAPCLLQNQEALVLNDGHSNAITDALAGPGADLALQLSYTPQGGLGYYSPYIAAIRDIIGIFSSIHTAKYQYIPALALLDDDRMQLVLNTPPSFHNPKSVLVTALPVVAPVRVPPLEIVDPAPELCAQAAELLLPIGGAPLIYATHYAHELSLRVKLPDGHDVDLPATPDAERGGLSIETRGRIPAGITIPLDAALHGVWGFQPFDGPAIRLQPARAGQWTLASDKPSAADASALLHGGSAACVTGVTVRIGTGQPQEAHWQVQAPDTIKVVLPAHDAKDGDARIDVIGAGEVADHVTLAAPPAPAGFGASLIARDVRRAPATTPVTLAPGSADQIPADATLTFSLRADKGARFGGKEIVELTAGDGGETAMLAQGSGLTLADPQVAVATVKPAAALGPSAFGPLRARVRKGAGVGDWVTLGTLVRLPSLRQITCPSDPAAACELSGDALFLIGSVSATPGFEHPVDVPAGYPGNAIQVPHPIDGRLYVKLHDDPATVAAVTAAPTPGT